MRNPEAIETILIGVVAKNMGYAKQGLVYNAGKEAFKFIQSLTHKEFKELKKFKTQTPKQ